MTETGLSERHGTDWFHDEAADLVGELLAREMVQEPERDGVEELLNNGEPLKALRVARRFMRE